MAGYQKLIHKGAAAATTLTSSLSNVATSCTIAAYTGWPYGSDPFYVVVSPGSANEEKILVTRTGATDTALNVVTNGRGADDTTAQSHEAGAAIFPVFTAVEASQANTVASTLTTKGDLLVHTGSAHAALAVGTNGHALVADSAQTNGVKWAAVGDVTLTGSQTLTNKTIALGSNTVSGTLAQFNTAVSDADLVSLAGTETLTNKTLTSPTINTATVAGGTVSGSVLVQPEERWNVSATAATGTVNVDVVTSSAWYYTTNASANWTLNFRGNSGTTLSSLLAVGDSITVVFASAIGTTQYRPTTFQIDGNAVTPKWQGGTAPTTGNASSTDIYSFTIIKTAATPTYTVFASQTKFGA